MEESSMSTQLEALPRTTPGESDPVSMDVPRRGPGRHLRLFYVIRTISVLGALGMAFFYMVQTGSFQRYHVFIFLLGVAYPHLSYFLEMRLEHGRRIEHATLLLDAFISGSVMHIVEFSLLPSLAVMMIAIVNPVAFTGFSMMGWSVLAMILGIALPSWIYGVELDPNGLPVINLAAAVYLFVYYCMFAYAVFVRTNALQKSRREVHQQKIIAEIEKKRSDTLLLGILPGAVAKEFASAAAVLPRRHESAVLLAVALPEFSCSAEQLAPAEFFAELNHAFKALDAICGRHGLESIKTAGDCYKAATGLGQRSDAHAAATLHAALEIQLFLEGRNASRLARNLPPLEFQIVAHAGPVVSGVVETRKFSYDLFGDTVGDLEQLVRHAPRGQIVASAALCEQAGGAFAYRRLEDLPGAKGRKIAVRAVTALPSRQ